MRLSTKSRYGTRAVLDIALYEHEGPVTLNDIARRQHLSKKYLGQIVTRLLAAGILESMRGPHGGYVLARDPASIRVAEIIRVLEGSVSPVRCVEVPASCRRTKTCVTRQVWATLTQSIESAMDGISIADLVEQHKAKERSS
jgi:Rrf2 family protein